jgi:hypothetical protein
VKNVLAVNSRCCRNFEYSLVPVNDLDGCVSRSAAASVDVCYHADQIPNAPAATSSLWGSSPPKQSFMGRLATSGADLRRIKLLKTVTVRTTLQRTRQLRHQLHQQPQAPRSSIRKFLICEGCSVVVSVMYVPKCTLCVALCTKSCRPKTRSTKRRVMLVDRAHSHDKCERVCCD